MKKIHLNRALAAKKKLTILFALLCASVMSWAVPEGEYIGSTDAKYSNQFKWFSVSGETAPQEVVNFQPKNEKLALYVNVGTAGYDGVKYNGVASSEFAKQDAGAWFYMDQFTTKCTLVEITNSGTVVRAFRVQNDACSGEACGGGGSTPDPDPDPDPTPDPNSYTAGGHTIHLEAYHVNDIYTLVITSADDMTGLGGSFWYVNGASTDMRSKSGANSYTVSGDKKTITCQVQSSSAPSIHTPLFVLMPGEVNFGNVTLNWENRTPITSEYCNYQDPQTIKGGKNIALTWETDGSGNVIITMQNGIGASSCSFRDGGFEGGIGAFVVSNDDFVTTTPASDYFTAAQVYSGNTYTLTKIADIPANAKIKHVGSGHALAWVLNGNNEYCYPDFIYTYGGTCNQLDAPTNVAIDGTNHITFDAVAGADSYMAYVSLGGVEKYSQAVASGDELTFVPLVSGDYTVNVIASGAGKVDSDPSADYVWHLEAAPVVLGNSEYCEKNMSSGNTEAAFTWETDNDGNIIITISEVLGGDVAATHFRNTGMRIDRFSLGTTHASIEPYFSHSCVGNQVTLTLKDPANAPALGEKIYFNNTVEYTTSQDPNAWPTLNFEWTYGTVCSGKSVSASVNNSTMGSAVAKVGEDEVTSVEENTAVTFIATSADPALYRFVNWTKGGVEVSTDPSYTTPITETTNLVANFDYIRETYCRYEVLATGGAAVGKKLYMTLGSIGGGKYQIRFDGSAEAPLLGLNNANYMVNGVSTEIEYEGQNMSGQDVPFNKGNRRWSFDGSGYGSAKMVFGLAEGKTIDDIYVWSNAIFFDTPLGELAYEDNNERHKLFGMNAAKRHNIDWDATCSDTEPPVFAKAEAEVLNESSVRLKIQATDNWGGLLTYTIAREGAEPIIIQGASGEELTQDVTGLTAGTEYTFTVTVSDGVNSSSQNIVVTPVADNIKPVMTSASLESNTWNSVIINVAATDNKGVTAYRVVNVDPVIDAEYVAEDGKITVEGLTANTAYSFTITAKDAAGNESANSKSVEVTTTAHYTEPQAACPAPTWDASLVKAIYSTTYSANCNLGEWGSGTVVIDDTYGKKYTIGPNGGEGGYFGMVDFTLNCLLMEKLHFDIWVADDMTIRIVPIWGGAEQGITKTLVGQQWNSIDIDLTEYTGVTNWSNITQMKLDHLTKNVDIWVANAYFYREAAYVDNEAPTNVSASKVAEGFYSVQISAQAEDNSGAVTFKVKNGDVEVAMGAAASAVATTITINNLTPGTNYNFSVVASDEAGNEVAPVPVAAQTKALPASAPAPDFRAKQIVPVFTDATTCVVTDILSGGWGETTTAQWLDIAANDKVFYVQNFDYAGWHSWGGGNINATGMQYLHVDVYSIGATNVNVTPISPGHEGVANITLTPNAWTSYDVPLSAYDANNIDWANIFQFKFMGPVGGNELMIDNVYFWKEPDYVRDDSWMAPGELGTICIPNGAVATGGDIYELVGKNEVGKIVFATVTNNEMTPGKPYLFQAKSNAMNFYYTSAAPAGEPENSGAMKGTFAEVTLMGDQLNNVYYFAGHALWSCVDLTATGLHVSAYRAWVVLDEHMPTISTSNPAPGRRYIYMGVNGQNATTGFGEVQGDDQQSTKVLINGHLFIRRGEKTYDATGRLVK